MRTFWPSVILISCRTPAEGDGISASTLSVEISKSGSSRSTLSPGFLSHLVIVPSKMLSPIWGMTTSTAMTFSPCLAGLPRDWGNLKIRGALCLTRATLPVYSENAVTETRVTGVPVGSLTFNASGSSRGSGLRQALDGFAGSGLVRMQLEFSAISLQRGGGLPALFESGTQGVVITVGVRADHQSVLEERHRFPRAVLLEANLAEGKPGVGKGGVTL